MQSGAKLKVSSTVESWELMPDPSSETARKGSHVLVLGTHHQFQRHQDTSAQRERVRADFEKLLRKVIEERRISVVAEEASDDKAVWESLRKDEELAGGFRGLFGDYQTVDAPVPTIAKELAKKYGVTHADVDVDVRSQEGDAESIAKRDAAMTEKILSGCKDAESVLVIVGELHRAGVSAQLKNAGWTVESLHFPNA
jgi:hypothetical protein